MELTQLTDLFVSAGTRKTDLDSLLRFKSYEACGLAGSSAAVLVSAIKGRKVPVLVTGDDADDAGYIYHDLSRLCGPDAVAFLPSGYRRALKYAQPDEPNRILRTETLARLSAGDRSLRFVVTYPEALAERVAARNDLQKHTLALSVDKPAHLTDVTRWLLDNHFVKTDYVYEPGQFALRGSILDIFGYSLERPIRIDFFGDDIDSIRTFDVETQLSDEKLDTVSIVADQARSTEGRLSLPEFLDPSTLLVVRSGADTTARVRAIAADGISDTATLTASAVNAEESARATAAINAARADIVDADAFDKAWHSFKRLTISAAQPKPGAVHTTGFQCSPQAIYHKNFDLIGKSFSDFTAQGYRIYILSDSDKQFARLRAIFDDRGDKITFEPVLGTLHQGFVDHVTKACVFTDHQIFDRFHKYTLKSDRARSGKLALSLKELQAIEVGDYIVHIDHGVGKFGGLVRTNVNGTTQEMIKLIYQNDDVVFVSIHALHKLSKYRGKEGVPPKINKLGTGAWNKLKERTKDKLKDIARDLIQLYAARKEEKGFAFSPDSYLQHELEASFVYEDTPDQLTATQQVKADMESSRPMDRLVCGDVGFGKTEVAVRAAFKAATDGKQVAVLVPTTVLAYQHFRTFSERLADFPVRVEYLSRARTAKQTKQIVSDLAEGKIDIIVGTHKLIGKSVKFKDLGLLVVDEEQKFGVAVKERLRQLKTNVDTLTMSATPIPRTLQFSLMGARDLSSINTPPANRYPIITQVSPLSDELVAEAINFELSRNGQVFFINNRIEGLTQLETMIRRLVPDARVAVAHGRMEPEKLEQTIVDFANHDYDVLLATTIVESGVDMPNVNTIIINNAQNFGLSELHQLRGRVGRSNRKAFAYLTVPSGLTLSPVARRRLQAIESFSDLGSGIHIAMQDLDIRGAGNLLGAEQSGFIADLGYETYQKILKEAVIELRTQEFADLDDETKAQNAITGDGEEEFVADTTVESDLELLLPADYVPQESERINLYRELDAIDRDIDIKAFAERLKDRFGPLPHVTEELIQVPRLRRLARHLGIEKIALKQGKMFTYFVNDANKAYYQSKAFGRMLSYLQLNPRRVQIREVNMPNGTVKRSFSIANVRSVTDAVTVLDTIRALPSV